MSEKKFEITYSDEAKKVIGPIGESYRFPGVSPFGLIEDGEVCTAVSRVAVEMADRLDDEICRQIVEVAKEQGCSSVYILDKNAIAEKLKRLEPKKIIAYDDDLTVMRCPTCHSRIGKYPFCKYCGQALEIDL